MKWDQMYRRYLALRRPEDFAPAVAAAPEEVALFLELWLTADGSDQAEELVDPVIATLPGGEESAEGMTVRLAFLDLSVELCESFQEAEPELWDEALQTGIAACREAIEISSRLGDEGCVAFYASLMAAGFRNAGLHEQSLPPQRKALEIYRRLAKNEPSLYNPEVAITLSNLGKAYGDLRELESAREVYEEAIATTTIWRNPTRPHTKTGWREPSTISEPSSTNCSTWRRRATYPRRPWRCAGNWRPRNRTRTGWIWRPRLAIWEPPCAAFVN